MLGSLFIYCYAECRYGKCRNAECRYGECHNAECRYGECHNAECRYGECHNAECHGAGIFSCMSLSTEVRQVHIHMFYRCNA
jgi:hypothetical protein